MKPSVILESLLHPRWVLQFMLTGGIPMMENWKPYAPAGASRDQVAALYGTLTPMPAMTWEKFLAIRAAWPRNLVLKGILSPLDAARAADAGVNGIILSNHGGRQLDAAPSPIDVLPSIRAVIDHRVELLVDSGVRRGSDVVKAFALGANFCLFGRPWLYAAAAGGAAGLEKTVQIMRREIDLVMGQIGCNGLGESNIETFAASPAREPVILGMPHTTNVDS
jgi:L-lactate dehydrogenase (cytochrome)/(S)-mandelate dehydrogenase